MGLGRSQDENDMLGRFFQGLEQGIECALGEHVDFVDDVYLILRTARKEFYLLADVSDFIDAVVAGSVNFHNIRAVALGNFPARKAFSAGLVCFRSGTIEGFCKNPGDGGFSRPPWPAEQISMGNLPACQRVLQGPDDVILADDF